MYQGTLLRVAQMYVSSRAVAEEVVQETWLAVLNGHRPLRGPLLAQDLDLPHPRQPGEDTRRAGGPDDPLLCSGRRRLRAGGGAGSLRPRHWAASPADWPEARLLGDETLQVIDAAIESLPTTQRAVITLRDVQGWSAEEVRNVLELSETNQRVLLHRARSKVRSALEEYLAEDA